MSERKIVADCSAWLSAVEAASLLRVTRSRVYQLIEAGDLGVILLGGRFGRMLVDPASVQARLRAIEAGEIGPWQRRRYENRRRGCEHPIKGDGDVYSNGSGSYRCRACRRAYQRRYYAQNRDKILAQQCDYYYRRKAARAVPA